MIPGDIYLSEIFPNPKISFLNIIELAKALPYLTPYVKQYLVFLGNASGLDNIETAQDYLRKIHINDNYIQDYRDFMFILSSMIGTSLLTDAEEGELNQFIQTLYKKLMRTRTTFDKELDHYTIEFLGKRIYEPKMYPQIRIMNVKNLFRSTVSEIKDAIISFVKNLNLRIYNHSFNLENYNFTQLFTNLVFNDIINK
jgi:hypothetical protein